MRERLEQLVAEMVDRGIDFDDAQREFQKQFIARVVSKHDGNLGKAATALGVHRNTLTEDPHGPILRDCPRQMSWPASREAWTSCDGARAPASFAPAEGGLTAASGPAL
jgi:hypothetical protein